MARNQRYENCQIFVVEKPVLFFRILTHPPVLASVSAGHHSSQSKADEEENEEISEIRMNPLVINTKLLFCSAFHLIQLSSSSILRPT
jgi:hypothetical protein